MGMDMCHVRTWFCGGCKRASDILELEVWMIVSHSVDAGNGSFGKAASVLNHWAIASDPKFVLVEV